MLDNLQNIELEAIFLSSLIQINKINEIVRLLKWNTSQKNHLGQFIKLSKI